ncbi:uridine kinase [Erwinia psidii]|uniref:Phosphoribulokinase n=1 Tax=Erwinia psidii TaxID=69224 RepID=A0A3N6SLN7_9GAMM|nr:uridine kinase [Erwinia psidii]MCX8956440.1 uridine kinase [Erwinia psidii]MCX8962286.1 uridine kinase [Erwinia psidii]RQM39771.1 uridine kinase [Erwinia psidii]
MNKLYRHPYFFIGLAIRVALIFFIAPLAVTEWFAPFLDNSLSSLTLDPWTSWIHAGGVPLAFPYGYAMWLVFLPLTLLAKLAGAPLHYGYELTLLVADFCMLVVLNGLLPGRKRLLLVIYWLSPVVILASYVLGLNDLIPALLLVLSIFAVRRVQLKTAGVLCAAAISAKLSMIVALPFIIIYLYNNKALRQIITQFLSGLAAAAVILGLPFLFSSAGLEMLFGNPEMGKIYNVAMNLGENFSIYIVPLIYFVLMYSAWRVRRLNFDLFQTITGMAFLLIVLMTPASPGWFVWSMPFLLLYQARSGRLAGIFITVFSLIYVFSTLLVSNVQLSNGQILDLAQRFNVDGAAGDHAVSLLHTSMMIIGVVLAIRIWREEISRNDFFRLSRRPFVVGIAGDSGAGKDTLSDAVSGLFGNHSVVKLSGDDYHLWDRQKPMWQVMTHLNPMANDLEGFCSDLISLTDGKSIHSRHYDHQTGKMSRPFRIASNDIIIASGLHALYLPILRDCYNLKIYLNIDEGLRRYLKIKRDVHERGHTLEKVLTSFNKRESDSERFIRPQLGFADLALSLQPIHPRMLENLDGKQPLRLKLVVTTRHGFNELSLSRVLVGVCGLHVDIVVSDDGAEILISIEGETSAADIELAAKILCPSVIEFLDITPAWQDGMVGLMQLITLSHISQAMTKRFVK